VIEINVTSNDLLATRFAVSPLWEIVASYRVLLNTERHIFYRDWVKLARTALATKRYPYIDALLTKRGYVPDFLTPRPPSLRPTLTQELAVLAKTPAEIVQGDLESLRQGTGSDSQILNRFSEQPEDSLACLTLELEDYWQNMIAPHWDKMLPTLEGDILYRARLLTTGGYESLFKELHPVMNYEDNRLIISKDCSESLSLDGKGLVLIPLYFSTVTVCVLSVPVDRPTISYPARGTGLWHIIEHEAKDALDNFVGEGRAKVMRQLVAPTSTGEIARNLNVTPSAVSQHLSKLCDAGLVASQRSGRWVYYSLTRRGEKLLALFE